MRQDMMNGLAEMLRSADPANPHQTAEAEALAGGVMAIAMAFVQERFGKDAASLLVESTFEQTAARVLGEGKREPVGSSIPALHPAPRKEGPDKVRGRAEVMLDFIARLPVDQAHVEARASIWASATAIRNREGESAALDFLSFVRSQMGMLGWFEQLPVASLARH